MKASELKAGDILFHEPAEDIGWLIVGVTGGKYSHVGQVLPDGRVAEMTVPVSRIITWEQWVAEYGPVYVGPLKQPLTDRQTARLQQWWLAHIGEVYDTLLLLGMAGITWWQRLCWKLGWYSIAKIQPLTLSGVCSTAVATACQYAGLPVDETSGMTPEDLTHQTFIGPIEAVE